MDRFILIIQTCKMPICVQKSATNIRLTKYAREPRCSRNFPKTVTAWFPHSIDSSQVVKNIYSKWLTKHSISLAYNASLNATQANYPQKMDLIRFPVFILIHWGMGLFCRIFFASFLLIRKVLCAASSHKEIFSHTNIRRSQRSKQRPNLPCTFEKQEKTHH